MIMVTLHTDINNMFDCLPNENKDMICLIQCWYQKILPFGIKQFLST